MCLNSIISWWKIKKQRNSFKSLIYLYPIYFKKKIWDGLQQKANTRIKSKLSKQMMQKETKNRKQMMPSITFL